MSQISHVWHGDAVWCHKVTGIKGGTTDDAFRERGFLWERGASAGADFYLFHSKDCYMHKSIKHTEENKNKNKTKVSQENLYFMPFKVDEKKQLKINQSIDDENKQQNQSIMPVITK